MKPGFAQILLVLGTLVGAAPYARAQSAAAPEAACDAPTISLDRCAPGEDKAFTKYIHDLIVNADRKGLMPAVIKETGDLDRAAWQQAAYFQKILWSTMKDFDSAAQGASKAAFGDANRREAFSFQHSCAATPNQFYSENQVPKCPAAFAASSAAVQISTTAVYASNQPASTAAQNFLRTQLIGAQSAHGAGQSAAVCQLAGGDFRCAEGSRGYTFPVAREGQSVTPIFIQSRTELGGEASSHECAGSGHMVNTYAVSIQEKSVCGGTVQLIPQFLQNNTRGFSHATALGMVIPVTHGKSIVVGDANAQAFAREFQPSCPFSAFAGSYILHLADHVDELRAAYGDSLGKAYRAALNAPEPILNGMSQDRNYRMGVTANACVVPPAPPSAPAATLGLQLDQILEAGRRLAPN